jgi:membrane glycosyltransferase
MASLRATINSPPAKLHRVPREVQTPAELSDPDDELRRRRRRRRRQRQRRRRRHHLPEAATAASADADADADAVREQLRRVALEQRQLASLTTRLMADALHVKVWRPLRPCWRPF